MLGERGVDKVLGGLAVCGIHYSTSAGFASPPPRTLAALAGIRSPATPRRARWILAKPCGIEASPAPFLSPTVAVSLANAPVHGRSRWYARS